MSQHESVIGLRPGSSFSILEATTWGMLYYATEIDRERDKGIHVYHLVGQLLVFLEHARSVITAIGYAGPLTIDMRMQAIRGVPWIYIAWMNTPEAGPASPLDDEVEFSIDTTTDDLTGRRDALVMDILRYLFYATNWTLAVSAERLEDYLKAGYKYNMWAESRRLRI